MYTHKKNTKKNEKYTAIPTGNTYVLPISTNALKYIQVYKRLIPNGQTSVASDS